jgi:hypothetical protein
VWSRPRPATAIGPGRPAGPARAARVGSAAQATSCSVSPKFAVLRSRRDCPWLSVCPGAYGARGGPRLACPCCPKSFG